MLVPILVFAGLACQGCDAGMTVVAQETAGQQDLLAERKEFQSQELTNSRFGGWVFQVGSPPKIIWRDVDAVRRLGRDVDFRVRWFDAELNEFETPEQPGRWMAWVEGVAPNRLPFRRAFTYYAFPKKIENGSLPDLSVEFPNFPGPAAPPVWLEHQAEFERAGKDLMIRGLLNSERGAILISGVAESKPAGRPKRFIETTGVMHDDYHLALKLKLQELEDTVRPLRPARIRTTPATKLHEGSAAEAGVAATAKSAIDAYCEKWVAATDEPFVVLVARKGVIVTHRAFGKDKTGKAIGLDYRCWIASLTKTVTGLMFSQFLDQESIGLDASLSSVFPDYPPDNAQVPTFRQCLNHTAGLAGRGEFGGMRNAHLENVVLNGIDVIEPGKAHAYSGLGFELVAKAMEIVAGKSAVRLYHEHFFEPLGFGDVVLGNASADGEFTAGELAILGQWMANRGSYGNHEFISPATFERLLPEPLEVPGKRIEYGLGLQWIRHRIAGAPANSEKPEDLLFSPRTIGHGSFSGCILVVDLEQQLVIAQVRKKFADADNVWWAKFFQEVAQAIEIPEESTGLKEGHWSAD